MKSIKKYETMIPKPKTKPINSASALKALIDKANKVTTNKSINQSTMNNSELSKYKPYNIGKYTKEGYADIIFQSDGVMTVPKNSASAIVDMLNDAFSNGVKMTLKNATMSTSTFNNPEPVFKSTPMPVEQPHPISAQLTKRR